MADTLTRTLRWTGAATGAAGLAFWIYTFHAIAQLPPGDHTGFQWLAEFPLTMIFLFLSGPALALALSRRLAAISAGFGIAGLIAYAMLWRQLLTEFAGLS